jgi:hypothetical protein
MYRMFLAVLLLCMFVWGLPGQRQVVLQLSQIRLHFQHEAMLLLDCLEQFLNFRREISRLEELFHLRLEYLSCGDRVTSGLLFLASSGANMAAGMGLSEMNASWQGYSSRRKPALARGAYWPKA